MPKLLDEMALERPNRLAIADEFGRSSWSELHERTRRLIRALQGLGLGPGDTLATMMGNRRECFEVIHACAHLGTVFVPINWHWVQDEVAYVLGDAGATVLIVDPRFADVAKAALKDPRTAGIKATLRVGKTEASGGAFSSYEEALANASSEDLPADQQKLGGPMFYTSGTTGRPKGVRGSLSGSSEIPTEFMKLVAGGMKEYVPEKGTTLLVGPVYHSAQWAFSFFPMVNGSAVVMRHKFDAAETIRLIGEESITNLHVVPTQFKRMLDCSDEERAAYDGASLEAVWHGAAPCPPTWKRAMVEWFGPKVHEYYGSTEGAFISTLRADEWLVKGGSVGKPLDAVEVLVVDDNGQAVGANEEGTLYFRNKMGTDFEYHNAPEKTAEAHLEPGVFTTGDIGYLDDEGYLWLSDRKIDMIISGGVNIYPAEIEAAIAEHSSVADVAVIGVPNEEFGEEVKAVVEVTAAARASESLAEELMAVCRARLAGYKRPKTVDFVAEMPRTGTGKILKRTLREPYWKGTGRRM